MEPKCWWAGFRFVEHRFLFVFPREMAAGVPRHRGMVPILLGSRPPTRIDLVIACDNAVPHLLTDEELVAAFGQFLACTRPGGGCLITVRDYDREERAGVQVKPYGVRDEGGVRYLLWQVWEFRGPVYDLAMYFVADRGGSDCTARVMRSRYYAVGTDKLMELMRQAGFVQVERIDGRFYQPVLLGRRSAEPGAAADRGGV